MKIRNLVISTALVASTAIANFATAGQENNIEILRVGCNTDSSACSLFLATDVSDPAAGCSGSGSRVNFDSSSAGGKNILASALTIKAAGFLANMTISSTECAGVNPKLVALTAN